MNDIPVFIVDASVIVKWLLPLDDEPHISDADSILMDYRDGRIDLLAPEQLRSEIGHALRRADRRGRITSRQGRSALEQFYAWRIPTVRDDALQLAGWDFCHRYDCSYYDGLYGALAEAVRRPLVYADLRLRNTLQRRFDLALWIEDYSMK
jgi:predicted nucleic acid-binding protein